MANEHILFLNKVAADQFTFGIETIDCTLRNKFGLAENHTRHQTIRNSTFDYASIIKLESEVTVE